MKIIMGLSAALLGTTLLAGAANAQNNNNNNNNNNTPPSWHWNGQPPRNNSAPPAPQQNAPANPGNGGNEHGNAGGHPNFAGGHGQNQARWNHVVTFHDHNVAHFNTQDRAMWAQGQWRHTKHNGRNGWWWNTNGAWFFYDEPTYPYPDSVSDDYSFDDDYADAPDQGPGPNGYSWYYCNNPAGYYPYVQSCRGPWQPVTPTPPPGYGQGPQGGPDSYQDEDDDRGPPPGQPPHGQFDGPQGGPPPGYNGSDDDDNQGPPPPGYNGNQGPQGYGPPPGYNDQPPPRY